MNKEEICYAIKLTNGGYVTLYQEYGGADVHVLSTANISKADYWDENEIEEAFKELIENEDYMFFENSPVKIVRVIVKVEEEWQ